MDLKLIYISLGILLMPMGALAQQQTTSTEPLAMITDLQGKAKLIEDSNTKSAEILTSLYQGNRVELEENTKLMLAYYANGREYHFSGPATIKIRGQQPEVLTGKAASVRELKLIKEIKLKVGDGQLDQAAIRLRGSNNTRKKIKLLSPVNTKLLSTHPIFRWEDFEGSSQYRFTLLDDVGKSLYESQVNRNKISLPGSILLQPGMLYSWQLEARMNTGAAYLSTSNFEIAPESIQKEMRNFLPAKAASFSERLVYARVLEQHGFTVDARNYWKILGKLRPDSAELKRLSK